MYRHKLWVLSIILVLLAACRGGEKTRKDDMKTLSAWETGKVFPFVKILKDTTQSYALYLPENYHPAKPFKTVLLFDPHAKGVQPVEKYRSLADKYGVILACSNNSQNGMTASRRNDVITQFIGDVEQRFNVDKDHLITAGLSGGARIAALIGIFNDNVKGIIGCGGGFPGIQKFNNTAFTWVGIAGNQDFNFLELKNLYNQLKLNHLKAYLLTFDGKHEWPPVEVMDEAFGILLKNKTKDLRFAVKDVSKITSWDKEEVKQQNLLVRHFNDKDLAWWLKKISTLKEQSEKAPVQEERLMNARLLAYLGMVSYMFISEAAKTGNLKKLEKYLSIYQAVEPQNPDMFYFRAVQAALQGNKEQVLTMLAKAVDNGFEDVNKLKSEKAFARFYSDERFQQIKNRISAGS